ncbi:MAG TPA: YeeE/YedE family protein [Acidiferrobacteraceae bacterium]|nr:YeeE/YedE family protein [Acidiferrobacteraceae bacterium]
MDNIHRVALAAFVIAAAFGAIANKTNFCTMGAVSDWVNMGDKGRLRAWFLAIGIAIFGAQFLQYKGLVDLHQSIYLTTNFGWLGHLLGGLCFGVGMTLGSGCGQRTLVRVGSGNLKSVVVVMILAITAYMTLRGLLALPRIDYIEKTNVDLTAHSMASQSIPAFLVALTGLKNGVLVHQIVAVLMGLGFVGFAFKDREFRTNFDNVFAGLAIGFFVVAAWYVTGVMGKDDFNPVPLESFTFVSPIGNTLEYLMTYTGSTISFGIAAMFGMVFGSFVFAVASGKFRIETFSNKGDMIQHMIGGALMGFGGVLALGCTIGQGVTGMSTLALGSLITLVSMILGSAITQKVQYYSIDESFGKAMYSALADMRLLPARRAA